MKLFIFGQKSTAIEILEIALSMSKYEMIYLVDDHKEKFNDYHFITQKDIYKLSPKNIDEYINSPSGQKNRENNQRLIQKLPFSATRIINKQSYISPSAKIGVDVYIAGNVSISSNVKVSNSSIINFNSVIGHDTMLHSNVVISPGVTIGGNCLIGERTFIGANSFIKQGTSIGNNVSIDALTHIYKNIEDESICTSRNLKVFKKRIFSE